MKKIFVIAPLRGDYEANLHAIPVKYTKEGL